MRLTKLINDGKRFAESSGNPYNDPRFTDEKRDKWVGQSLEYLNKYYPESILTKDFLKQSEKTDKNYDTMISILQGLKDVEEEIGNLKE